MIHATPPTFCSKTTPKVFLLTLLTSVSPGYLLPRNQVLSLLYFHPHIPNLPAGHVANSQLQESPSHLPGILPTLLYTDPNSTSWPIIGLENLRTYQPKLIYLPGNVLLSDQLATRGQRKLSCSARLKSSALFSTYGNAIFQVFFILTERARRGNS